VLKEDHATGEMAGYVLSRRWYQHPLGQDRVRTVETDDDQPLDPGLLHAPTGQQTPGGSERPDQDREDRQHHGDQHHGEGGDEGETRSRADVGVGGSGEADQDEKQGYCYTVAVPGCTHEPHILVPDPEKA
jgi:hypothetical protein